MMLATKDLRIHALDNYAKEIYETDELYEGWSAKMLTTALLSNVRTAPLQANNVKALKYYIAAIASKLIALGYLTPGQFNEANTKSLSHKEIDTLNIVKLDKPKDPPSILTKMKAHPSYMAHPTAYFVAKSQGAKKPPSLDFGKDEDMKDDKDKDPEEDRNGDKGVYDFRKKGQVAYQLPNIFQ